MMIQPPLEIQVNSIVFLVAIIVIIIAVLHPDTILPQDCRAGCSN